MWNDPLTATFHNFARAIRGLGGNGMPDAWADFLYWDDGASEQDCTTLPRSYRATNYVAMRTDWTPNATWASLRAAAYIDYINQSEQYPDAGALVITRGNTPFLVNPLFLHRCYTETDNAQGWDNQLYDEIYNGAQAIFNVFYNTTTSGQTFVEVDSAPPPATGVTRFEDQNGYVYTRAQDLADVYPSSSNVTAWSRDVVFFRNASVPGVFLVYDRTTSGAGDPHMHWHFPPAPAVATPPATGAKRYDVTDGVTGFKGALTTLLPANAVTQVDQVFSTSRLWRIVVRPPSPTSDMRWLTVLDPAMSPGAVALGSVITSSANVKGALLAGGGGNKVALFGASAVGVPISGTVTFTEPAVATTVVLTDLAPNTNYAVTTAPSGGNSTVTVAPGSGFTTSEYGTLYVHISATGDVTAGN